MRVCNESDQAQQRSSVCVSSVVVVRVRVLSLVLVSLCPSLCLCLCLSVSPWSVETQSSRQSDCVRVLCLLSALSLCAN